MAKEPYYITTPIYYTNGRLHIGNSYTTVATDVMARYKKLRGYDVRFLTGTDEHGQKVERAAAELGLSPKAYVDGLVAFIKPLWQILDVQYDQFIRTTDDYHEKAVQKIFKKLHDNGDIYKGVYEGLYCAPCESFFTERQVTDGKCPDCGRPVEPVREEAYFFRLSRYQHKLERHLEEHPDFILPLSRRNEMINNFLKPGLEDLCVTRTTFTWGVPVDFDPKHVVYVWVDALTNYITALGYTSDDDGNFRKYWPADLHLMGKEIVRFHSIIWPALLMALDLPLPKRVFGHGWLTKDGQKISKSMGNAVDPEALVARFGVDAVRYFLMREFSFGKDGDYTNESLVHRINSDLANDFGNLLSRTVGMIDKYFGGRLPEAQAEHPLTGSVRGAHAKAVAEYALLMDELDFSGALTAVWRMIARANKFVDETEPWVLARDDARKDLLAGVLYTLAEALRVAAALVSPFMPNCPLEVRRQLGITDPALAEWDSVQAFGALPRAVAVTKGAPIFPRLDVAEALADLEENSVEELRAHDSRLDAPEPEPLPQYITIDDFAKIKMATGVVLSCERVEGAAKLLKSQIRIGAETRQVVSGIADWYEPEQMVGKTVVVVTNLKPVKLRGALSEGMILAASEGEALAVVTTDKAIADGAEVR